MVLESGQSPASPEKAAGVERECNVSCVDAVQGCTDPVAGTCCRSHLQNDHGLEFRAYKSHKGRGDGKGGMDQPVQGPWHGHKGNAWEHPDTSWFIIPRLVRRPVHVPWPSFFFSAALYCTTSGPEGKVTSSHAGYLPL